MSSEPEVIYAEAKKKSDDSTSHAVLVPRSVLMIRQSREIHGKIAEVIQKIESGDPPPTTMGGGFGGCVVGFIRPSYAAAAVEAVKISYQKLYPEVAGQAAVYLARADDGVRFI